MINPLWKQWEKTSQSVGDKVVLVDAATQATWTAHDLSRLVEKFSVELSNYPSGVKIGFRLSGSTGIALFLALQKAGLVAVPFDVGMPKTGCRELAKRLRVHALYWDGTFHTFEGPCDKERNSSYFKITSGSSEGHPKIIKCRAEHLLADGRQVINGMGMRPVDRHLAVIPLGHSYGLGSLVMPLILQGATLVYADQFVPRQLIEWINRFHITVFSGVPALFRTLAALPGSESISSVRLVVSAGAPLQPQVVRNFFDRYSVKIHNFYGSSETGGICYDRTGSASLTGRSLGKPLDGVNVSLQRGKIVVKSPAVATSDGQWVLPDEGEWNGRKELVLLGRCGENANIGGKKVHPVEVERVLRIMPSVSDVGVWVLRGNGRDYLAAAVETKLSQAEIDHYLASCLPSWKIPKLYFIAPELPRSVRGKLDSALLRQKFEAA